jgi:hypothetical protein
VDLSFDDEFEETHLEIRELPGQSIVTVIELLSPTNKGSTEGRGQYLVKRREILRSRTNLVEIDLLRAGSPLPPMTADAAGDYRLLVSRGMSRERSSLCRFSYRDPIPSLIVPLLQEESVTIDLNPLLRGIVEQGRYFRRIDYSRPPVPPLRPGDEPRAAAIIAEAARPRPDE